MSRVIKFRAWHSLDESIVYFDKSKLSTDHYQMQYLANLMRGDYGESLMQFTGLQDKNGTDIYEGDIVVNEVVEEIYTVKFGAYGYTNTVGFHCVDSADDPHSFYGGMGDLDYLTVIGNIHENPELLEVGG